MTFKDHIKMNQTISNEILERSLEIYNSGSVNKTQAGKIAFDEFNVPYNDCKRRAISRYIDKHSGKSDTPKNIASDLGVDYNNVPYLWLKTKEASLFIKNPNYKVTEIDFDRVILECMAGFNPVEKIPVPETNFFDRLVWTDVHIGMDTSRNGLALYPVEWNEKVLMSRIDEMINFVLAKKTSRMLIIDELGDFMDGWNGETTRGGHKLPQNMNNEDAFEAGVKAKVRLVDELSRHYDFITCNNICDDNHSGAFGYVVNSTFKHIIDHKYVNVEVNNLRKFINYYIVGDHGFILSHGKDSRNLKFGFKPHIDARAVEKISQYIRHSDELKKCKYIEFSKGDSHQCLFDMCTSDEFDYFNFPAFSPSSEWVQTNFKKGRSGFVMQSVDKFSDKKEIKTYFFKS